MLPAADVGAPPPRAQVNALLLLAWSGSKLQQEKVELLGAVVSVGAERMHACTGREGQEGKEVRRTRIRQRERGPGGLTWPVSSW